MTPSQEMQTEGFLEQLPIRGQAVRLNGAGTAVLALVGVRSPAQGPNEIERETANASELHVLRSHLSDAGLSPITGNHWHAEDGTRYRINGIRDQSVRVYVIFECATYKQ
jgi:hypothetical protein